VEQEPSPPPPQTEVAVAVCVPSGEVTCASERDWLCVQVPPLVAHAEPDTKVGGIGCPVFGSVEAG
jgi:hypothetical protein